MTRIWSNAPIYLAFGVALSAPSNVLFALPFWQTINVPGSTQTNAYAINNNGDIVGAYTTQTAEHGFLLSGGHFTTIDVPGARFTFARGINDNGWIVGGYVDDAGSHGFLRQPTINNVGGGVVYLLRRIDVPPGTFPTGLDCFDTVQSQQIDFTAAMGINNSGDIVGVYRWRCGQFGEVSYEDGFLLSNNGTLSVFAGRSSPPNQRVQEQGDIVTIGISQQPYLAGSGRDLLVKCDNPSFCLDVSVIVSLAGFLIVNGTEYNFEAPESGLQPTQAYGINEGGSSVVGKYTDDGGTHGFLTTASAITNGTADPFTGFWTTSESVATLDFPGATGTEAHGVNDHVAVVGSYNNDSQGFLRIQLPAQQNATFSSTLSDIYNSGLIGFIDSSGIVDSLSGKIQAAQGVAGASRNKVLMSFANEVNAQAGKHINFTAANVLLQDANSLMVQDLNP